VLDPPPSEKLVAAGGEQRKGGEERHRIRPLLPPEFEPLMPDSATIVAITVDLRRKKVRDGSSMDLR